MHVHCNAKSSMVASRMESSASISEQELLPGLPDAVVMHFVLPRLPWYTRPRLLTVSKAWRAAFDNPTLLGPRTRELYHPTGLFLIHELLGTLGSSEEQLTKSPTAPLSSQDSDDESSDIFLLRKYTMEMYDLHGASWHRLPPIDSYPSEIPSRCSFVCVDGKLYVMGGVPDSTKEKESGDVHMLNVGSGHWWWERCASMHFSRAYVKCAVSGGCIYVVGGTCPAEVYDVGENRWERLPEMVDVQFFCNGIIALENQIFAYGYDILDPEIVIEPDVNSARVYDVLSRSWSSVGFDFSKCCTALRGRLLFDIIDGTLITYDMTSHVSTVFDGRLQVEVCSEELAGLEEFEEGRSSCRPSCQIYDLVAVDLPGKPLQVYTLASQCRYRLRQLWHGTLDFDTCKVTWDQNIVCPFKLGQLDSENLSEICYLYSP